MGAFYAFTVGIVDNNANLPEKAWHMYLQESGQKGKKKHQQSPWVVFSFFFQISSPWEPNMFRETGDPHYIKTVQAEWERSAWPLLHSQVIRPPKNHKVQNLLRKHALEEVWWRLAALQESQIIVYERRPFFWISALRLHLWLVHSSKWALLDMRSTLSQRGFMCLDCHCAM